MKVKEIQTVLMDGMTEFIKIDSDEIKVLVNVNHISTITQKTNGDIVISLRNGELIMLQDVTLDEITQLIEEGVGNETEEDW